MRRGVAALLIVLLSAAARGDSQGVLAVEPASSWRVTTYPPAGIVGAVGMGAADYFACEIPNQDPAVPAITAPIGILVSDAATTTVTATVTDPAPSSGVREIQFYYASYAGGAAGAFVLIATDTSSPYSVTWTLPACPTPANDFYVLRAIAVDACDNLSPPEQHIVRLTGRGC